MISSNGLMRGNWLQHKFNSKFYQIKAVTEEAIYVDGLIAGLHISAYNAIPLTADILLDSGFELWRPEDYKLPQYHFGWSFIIATTDKGFQYWYHNDQDDYFDFAWTELNTVHELQNFYFALYKKELEIKL